MSGASSNHLREEFDRGFSKPLAPESTQVEDFLLISAGGATYGLSMGGLSGIYSGRPVTPVPSSSATLLGVCSFRGRLVAVHRLSALLGSAQDGAQPTRWLAVLRAAAPVALAFDHFVGQVRARPGQVIRTGKAGASWQTGDQLAAMGTTVPIIDSVRLTAELSMAVASP